MEKSPREEETAAGHAGPRQSRVSTPGLEIDTHASTSQSRPERCRDASFCSATGTCDGLDQGWQGREPYHNTYVHAANISG